MLQLRVFGRLAIERDGALPRVEMQRRPLALLAFLAHANEHGVSRDKLLACFWPESSADNARNALNQLLHHVRRELGAELILGTGVLQLNSQQIHCDLWDFRAAIESGDAAAAATLYQGSFLDGFYLRGAPEFEQWVDATRAQLARDYESALEQLASDAERRGDFREAVTYWRKAVDAQPLSSRAALGLANGLVRAGDRLQALQFVRLHEQLVRAELDAPPAEEIIALAATLSAEAPRISAPLIAPESTHVVSEEPTASCDVPSPARRESTVGRILATVPNLRLSTRNLAVIFASVIALAGVVKLPTVLAHAADSALPRLDAHRFVVTGFENRTGKPELDYLGAAATDWVTQGLARVESLSVVHHSFELWLSPTIRDPQRSTQIRDIGRATGAATAVAGSYARVGDSLLIEAKVIDVATGTVLQSIDPVSGPLADPMRAVEGLRDRITSMVEARRDPMLTHWVATAGQPVRFDAYLEYAEGMRAFAQEDYAGATDHFRRAASEDTSYTLPRLWEVFALQNDDQSADSLLSSLEKRRSSMAPLDRALLDFHLTDAKGDAVGNYTAATRLVQLAPGSEFLYKLGIATKSLRRPHEAVAVLKQLDPNQRWIGRMSMYWQALGYAEQWSGNYADAFDAYEHWVAMQPADGVVRQREFAPLAALGRVHAIDSILTLADTRAAEGDWPGAYSMRVGLRYRAAWALRVYGHRVESDRIFQHLVDSIDVLVRPEAHRAGLQTYDRRLLTIANYELGHLSAARAQLADVELALARRSPIGSNLDVGAVGTLGSIATTQGDSVTMRRAVDLLRELPTHGGMAEFQQARIMAAGGNRDGMMRLLVAAISHGYEGSDLIPIEFVPYRDYPPFKAIMFPSN